MGLSKFYGVGCASAIRWRSLARSYGKNPAARIGGFSEPLEQRRLLSLTVPAYNSLPGAAKSIFLDFDGTPAFNWTIDGDTGDPLTFLAHGPGGSSTAVPAFTLDSDPNSFSSEETTEISQIYQYVAEKYSPFNVNVTTVDPGSRAHGVVEQVVIGGSVNDWLHQPDSGGISPIRGFSDPTQSNTAFVFSADVALKSANQRVHYLGDAAAHEVGHSMGLSHERTPGSDYYNGDSTRSPIMGNAGLNFNAKGIWWKTNNWPGQNSTDPVQDELDIMAGYYGPLSYRVDDYTNPAALTLTGDSTYAPVYGVIERSTDTDTFSFSPPSTAVSFTVNNATLGGMLTPNAYIYDANTGQVVTETVSNTPTQVTVSTSSLTAGRSYRLVVEGSGQYGDIGQYSVNASVTTFATYYANTGELSIGGQPGTNNVTVSVIYNGVQNPGLLQVSDSVNGGNPGVQTFPISSVNSLYFNLYGTNNSITVKPLAPLYNPSGYVGGPYVNIRGGGSDSVTLDAGSIPGNFTITDPTMIQFVSTTVHLFSGISNVTLQGGGSAVTTFNVLKWNHSVGLKLNGAQSYAANFEFDGNDFDPSAGTITVIGSNGSDSITVDASTLGGPLTGSVTNGIVNLGNTGDVLEGLILGYSNIESIDITATASADKLNVYSLPSTTTLSFHGGDGDDILQLGLASASISLDQILGPVYFYGDTGSNTGILDDASNAYGRTYVVDHTHVGTTAGGNLFNGGGVGTFTINGGSAASSYMIYQGQPNVTLNLNGGAGADSFNFDNATTWNAYIYGNGGLNSLTVDDRSGSSAPYRTDIRDQSVTHYYGTSSAPTAYAMYYNNIGSASYYGAPTTNLLNILSTSADIAAGYQWTVVMNSGNDTINVYPHNTATGAATLLGGIGILGGGGTDTITFDDSATPIGVTYRFYNPYGTSTADIAGLGGALVGVANDVENIAVLGSPYNDEFEIDSFESGSGVTFNGNGGNDTCDVALASKDISGSITSISSLTFNGGAGVDALNIHNDNSTVAWAYSQSSTSIVSSKSGYGLTSGNSGVETFSIAGGSAADSFLIQNAPGTTTTVAGGGGLNSVVVLSGGNVLFSTSQNLSALSLDTTATVTAASNGNLILRTNSLSIVSGAKLDLSNNTMILDYTGTSPAATIRSYLTSGRNGGTWNGSTGLTSSAVAGVANSALGYAEASTILGPTGGTFAGQTVDSTALLIRFTLLGDVNLDRTVDISDLGLLAQNWQKTNAVWSQGDVDYSGIVDISDLGLLATNWQKSLPTIVTPQTKAAVKPLVKPTLKAKSTAAIKPR